MEDRILVVADGVPRPGLRVPGRRLAQLLAELRSRWPGVPVTLVAAAGGRADRYADALRERGVHVAAGPESWDDWFAARRAAFSIVIWHGPVATRRLHGLVAATQPDARAVVDAGVLGGRPPLPHHEGSAPGGDLSDAALLDGAAAVWCSSEAERAAVAAASPGCRTVMLPAYASMPEERPGIAGRSGVVMLASAVEGLGQPDEDAVLFVAREVLPLVRVHAPDATLRVLGEDLPPGVRYLDAPGVEVAPLTEAVGSALERARVVVVARRFGPSSAAPVLAAAEAGVPVVATVLAVQAHGLPPGMGAGGEPWQLAERIRTLLDDTDTWEAARADLDAWTAAGRSAEAFRAALEDAMAALGVAPPDPRAVSAAPTEPLPASRWSAAGGRRWVGGLAGPPGPRPLRAVFPDQIQTEGLPPLPPEERGALRESYHEWRSARRCTPEGRRRAEQEMAGFSYTPQISVITPVFNTEPSALAAAIESVKAQVYPRWQLCLADDASTWPETLAVLRRSTAFDPRIVLVRRAENGHIVRASNDAIARATGEFITFLDHDDELDPLALFEVVKLLNRSPDLDFIYSDEEKVDQFGKFCSPALKPSWSPDLMTAGNYICHLAVYRRTMINELGGLREGYDGAQDLDLVLRVGQHTDRIAHIAKPLYTWRMIRGSVAIDGDAKPYAFPAGRRALEDALARRGLSGRVEEMLPYRGLYRTSYDVVGLPRVAVIVLPTPDHGALQRCVEGVLDRLGPLDVEVVALGGHLVPAEIRARLAGLGVRWPAMADGWSAGRAVNEVVPRADADFVLLLTADVEPRGDDWLERLVEHAQRPEVGAVGAQLRDPDGRTGTERVFVDELDAAAAHESNYLSGVARSHHMVVRNVVALTPACCMFRACTFLEVGGWDERLGDPVMGGVDLCLRIRLRGYEIVATPFARVVHRALERPPTQRADAEHRVFCERWSIGGVLSDPYSNPNYRLEDSLLHLPAGIA